jgi:hypothetical protein
LTCSEGIEAPSAVGISKGRDRGRKEGKEGLGIKGGRRRDRGIEGLREEGRKGWSLSD